MKAPLQEISAAPFKGQGRFINRIRPHKGAAHVFTFVDCRGRRRYHRRPLRFSSSISGDRGGDAAIGSATSTLDDQSELALTVYNSDLALVRDVRTLRLPGGEFDLQFMDIAATVNPATVHLRSLTEPPRLGILEQNYEYDLLEPVKLLRKYVGREVILVRQRQENGRTPSEESQAPGFSATTTRRCGRSATRS